jgi:hypothetical protein
MAEQLELDLVVGHSKGYPLAKKLNIPLIRVGFPIHDRVGGQRILHLGYAGAQQLFDTVANAMIEKKQDDSPVGYFICNFESLRSRQNSLTEAHPRDNSKGEEACSAKTISIAIPALTSRPKVSMAGCIAGGPEMQHQCNYCNRKYDCVNESRPGVTSTLLSPEQALVYMGKVLEKEPRISVAGIAGPGDPFANAEETLETMRLIRRNYPDTILCLSSNGMQVAPHVPELAEIGVSHVTITVNAVDPDISQKIYAWVRDGKVLYRGRQGAELLLPASCRPSPC